MEELKILLTDTLSHINNAITNIYTNIERDVLGDIEMIYRFGITSKEKELVDTFNELVTLEQKLIDILHPMRHEEGKLPNPTYLTFKPNSFGVIKMGSESLIKEIQRDYKKSDHLRYAKLELDRY